MKEPEGLLDRTGVWEIQLNQHRRIYLRFEDVESIEIYRPDDKLFASLSIVMRSGHQYLVERESAVEVLKQLDFSES
jgi:hypothetical protein